MLFMPFVVPFIVHRCASKAQLFVFIGTKRKGQTFVITTDGMVRTGIGMHNVVLFKRINGFEFRQIFHLCGMPQLTPFHFATRPQRTRFCHHCCMKRTTRHMINGVFVSTAKRTNHTTWCTWCISRSKCTLPVS